MSCSSAVRVAYSRHFNPQIAIDDCVSTIGFSDPLVVIAFSGGKHEPDVVFDLLRAAYPGARIVGGSAAGVIAARQFGYSGLEIGLLVFTTADAAPRVYLDGGLAEDEFQSGYALARSIAADSTDNAAVLLFFDSVAEPAPLRLHFASSIVQGFQSGLGNKRVRLVGGGLLTDINMSGAWVFDGAKVRKHASVALLFPPEIDVTAVVLHGCRPVSAFMEITRIEGAVVYELDGQPALNVIEKMLGLKIAGNASQELTLIATLGEKQGDPFAPYDENNYVNRLILSANRTDGSITLFEPDFRVGTHVQIMARDNALMLQSVRDGVAATNVVTDAEDCLFSLYIDCAGRASAMSGAPTEEAEVVAGSLDPRTPFLGFYSGVEIAPFDGYSRSLDWTGLLATFRYR